jgi:hypothetical protein
MNLLPNLKPSGEDNEDGLLTKIAVMLYEVTHEGKAISTEIVSGENNAATSAKQDVGNTSLANLEVSTGKPNDAVATTDTGTFSITALIKKISSGITNVLTKLNTSIKVSLDPASVMSDAGGRLRVSGLTTLADGKTLNSDNTHIFDNKGTGTGLWGQNKYNMTVTAGQYFIRQLKRYAPYFSGKSQIVECTFDNFQVEANVVKRVGYFSSSAVAPYTANFDGFYLENDGTTIRLIAQRDGTNPATTVNIPMANWDNAAAAQAYNWENFTVVAFDFLWLGGAILRLFLKTDTGFELMHTVNYSGKTKDTFILSPDQPIRYEIRSTTGEGSLRYICSQVATEGSINEEGYNIAVDTGYTAISLASVGTSYPILAVRKKATDRDVSVKVTGVSTFVSSTNDIILWSLQLNPTISAGGLVYSDVTSASIQKAVGNGTLTVTTPGRILASGVITSNAMLPTSLFEKDYLLYLGVDIDNTAEALVLVGTPSTSSISAFGSLMLKENTN